MYLYQSKLIQHVCNIQHKAFTLVSVTIPEQINIQSKEFTQIKVQQVYTSNRFIHPIGLYIQ